MSELKNKRRKFFEKIEKEDARHYGAYEGGALRKMQSANVRGEEGT